MKVAVEGCAHGELDKIYEAVQYLEEQRGVRLDLLICCGDFQATRNAADLHCMAVPPKYRRMCSFYKYYSGQKVAPVLTLFIGGNHEASNYLQELAYGGWVAPRIYYMGYASIVRVGGVRIGGLSGIYKGHDYMKGHFEYPPYSEDSKRSAYHVRHLEVFRLKQDSPMKGTKERTTKFLALDKCLPRRKFLQVLEIPHDPAKSLELEYDLEWLTIVYLTNHLLSIKRGIHYMPGLGADERCNFAPTQQELDLVLRKLGNDLVIPQNFTQTVTPYDPGVEGQPQGVRPTAQINSQTMALCERLGVDDPMSLLLQLEDGASGNISLCDTSLGTPGANTSVSFLMTDDSALELDSNCELELSTCSPRVSLRRSAIVLPSPQHSEPEFSDPDVPSSCNDDLSAVSQGSTGGEDASDTPDCKPADPQPKNKKFKRRNQAFYQSTDDD